MPKYYMSFAPVDNDRLSQADRDRLDLRDDKRFLAVISDGCPGLVHEGSITILSTEIFDPPEERALANAKEWFVRMLEERPWETRQ